MAAAEPINRYVIDRDKLPADWPTHAHDPAFWQELGRVIATFGFMEEILGKAIFKLTGGKACAPEAAQEAVSKWANTLEKALTDQLGGLIDGYAKALAENDRTSENDFSKFIENLKDAKVIRNVLCHGSWGKPDKQGFVVPRFVDRNGQFVVTQMDVSYLKSVRVAAAQLMCDIIDSVAGVGLNF